MLFTILVASAPLIIKNDPEPNFAPQEIAQNETSSLKKSARPQIADSGIDQEYFDILEKDAPEESEE